MSDAPPTPHSVVRYGYVETEPDEDGFRMITGFANHRTVQPKNEIPVPIPVNEEIEDFTAEANHWCRDVWIRAREVSCHE